MPKKASPFTDDEKKELQSAAYAVWEECGYDLLVAVAEDKGKDPNQVTIPRSHVIEIALDAGRPEEKLKRALDNARTHQDPVRAGVLLGLLEKLNAPVVSRCYTYEQLIAAVKPGFPYKRYGM